MTNRLVLVSDDLMSTSRVREALRALPIALDVVATEAAFTVALQTPMDAVLINLTARRYDPLALVRVAKAQGINVLAFDGHVEAEKHAAAREAGADLVVANSSVALHLVTLLPKLGLNVDA